MLGKELREDTRRHFLLPGWVRVPRLWLGATTPEWRRAREVTLSRGAALSFFSSSFFIFSHFPIFPIFSVLFRLSAGSSLPLPKPLTIYPAGLSRQVYFRVPWLWSRSILGLWRLTTILARASQPPHKARTTQTNSSLGNHPHRRSMITT